MPSCITAADIEQLVREIPVQVSVVVPVRTVQEAVAAGDPPPVDAEAANVFSRSERILQDHARQHNTNAAELKDLMQRVLHHPDFNTDEVDHDMHERLMRAVEEGYIEVIDMWEEGAGDKDVTFVKRKLEKVLRELMADPQMAGHQHYGFKLQANPRGERIYACEANGSVAFQLAQLSMGPDTVPMALVAYIDGTFMKRGIGIRPIYCEYIRYHI